MAGIAGAEPPSVCPQVPQNLKFLLLMAPQFEQETVSPPPVAGAAGMGMTPDPAACGAAMGRGAGAWGAIGIGGAMGIGAAIGIGAAMGIGAPMGAAIGGAPIGAIPPGIPPGVDPIAAGGVGAVKLFGAWAASRGSSAPHPRQNL